MRSNRACSSAVFNPKNSRRTLLRPAPSTSWKDAFAAELSARLRWINVRDARVAIKEKGPALLPSKGETPALGSFRSSLGKL